MNFATPDGLLPLTRFPIIAAVDGLQMAIGTQAVFGLHIVQSAFK